MSSLELCLVRCEACHRGRQGVSASEVQPSMPPFILMKQAAPLCRSVAAQGLPTVLECSRAALQCMLLPQALHPLTGPKLYDLTNPDLRQDIPAQGQSAVRAPSPRCRYWPGAAASAPRPPRTCRPTWGQCTPGWSHRCPLPEPLLARGTRWSAPVLHMPAHVMWMRGLGEEACADVTRCSLSGQVRRVDQQHSRQPRCNK